MPSLFLVFFTIIFGLLPLPAHAQSFTDVPATSAIAPAVLHLVSIGAVSSGGAFKPKEKLTRAQAVEMMIRATSKQSEIEKITSTSFSDIPPNATYLPFAELAKTRKIISVSKTFHAEKIVTKAEFLKMLLLARSTNVAAAFSDMRGPLSSDCLGANASSYAPIRYALASGMTTANKDGLLLPLRIITREDAALFFYRLDQFIAEESAPALLAQTEVEITNVLTLLDRADVLGAEYASNRAVLSVRGALTNRPRVPLVQGALKIVRGFQSLVQAYQAGKAGRIKDVIKYTDDTVAAANKAEALSASLSSVTVRMRAMSKHLVDAMKQ